MDLRVSLTWLLLLSATFLPESGSAALGSSQEDSGTGDQNSLWKKLEEWLKGLFNHGDETATSAPEITTTVDKASSLASTNTTEQSKTPEILTTPQAASEDTEELYISPTPLTGDGGTSAPEISSTVPESSTDYFVTDDFIISDPVTDSTESLTTLALPSTLSKASTTLTDVHMCDTVGIAPAEDTTPEAEALIKATATEKPVTHPPNPSVSLDSGAASITTSRAKTDPAPVSQENPISLPQYLWMELLRFLADLCGPRRPGMQSIQLQGCVKLPTCRNYHSTDKRIIKFNFRGPAPSRVCLHCNILACNRYNYSPQRYWGHRTRDEASESVIIRIIPI